MDDDGGDDDLQQTMGFTSEDFSELNDIINLTTTSSIEEISELYKSFNTTSDNGDNIEKEMPKVQKVESTTRHASAFEIVEKGRKCGVCHRVGHNSRTCPRKGEFNSSDPHFVLANQDVTLNMLETPLQCEISTSLEL